MTHCKFGRTTGEFCKVLPEAGENVITFIIEVRKLWRTMDLGFLEPAIEIPLRIWVSSDNIEHNNHFQAPPYLSVVFLFSSYN